MRPLRIVRRLVLLGTLLACTAANASDPPGFERAAERPDEGIFSSPNRPRWNEPEPPTRDDERARRRDEEIRTLEALLRSGGEQERTPDTSLRLANLHAEAARYVNAVEERPPFEKSWHRWIECNQDSDELTCGSEPRLSTQESDLHRRRAIVLYERIRLLFPQAPIDDRVTYACGVEYLELSKTAADGELAMEFQRRARDKFSETIAWYPQTSVGGAAYLEFAEDAWNRGDLRLTCAASERAVTATDPPVRIFARYILAWCNYSWHAYEKATKEFQEVVVMAEQATGKARILKAEALRDLIPVASEVKEISPVLDFIAKHTSPVETRRVVNRLAKQASDWRKYENAVTSYRYLLRLYYYEPDAPLWLLGIVRTHSSFRQWQPAFDAAQELIDRYGPDSDWSGNLQHSEQTTVAVREARELQQKAERSLREEQHIRDSRKTYERVGK